MELFWDQGHTEAMTDTLYVERAPDLTSPTIAQLSGVHADVVSLHPLVCRYLPMQEIVSKDQTGYTSLPIGIVVYDPLRLCSGHTIIRYHEKRYRITAFSLNPAHYYELLRLEQV